MAIGVFSRFSDFKQKIQSLPTISQDQLLSEQFLIEKDEKKNIEIYYAPFEYVNENAKVVIAGITPGLHQMKRSFSTVFNLKDHKIDDEEILHEVKKNSSFEGPMRKNLISMLDELQLHKYLGITSTSELFSTASHLVQTNSVICYPVFYKGKNYTGSTPNITTEILLKYIINGFAKEIETMNNPLIIPLGVNVTKVLDYLVENNYIEPKFILNGFPHTSGANGHRHRQFAENKQEMEQKLKEFFK